MHRYGAQRGPVRYEPITESLVVESLRRAVHPSVGLAFVPAAVEDALQRSGLPSATEAVKEMIRDLAVSGFIELQPESGLNRLTPREISLCPPGPHGTVLSWARFLR